MGCVYYRSENRADFADPEIGFPVKSFGHSKTGAGANSGDIFVKPESLVFPPKNLRPASALNARSFSFRDSASPLLRENSEKTRQIAQASTGSQPRLLGYLAGQKEWTARHWDLFLQMIKDFEGRSDALLDGLGQIPGRFVSDPEETREVLLAFSQYRDGLGEIFRLLREDSFFQDSPVNLACIIASGARPSLIAAKDVPNFLGRLHSPFFGPLFENNPEEFTRVVLACGVGGYSFLHQNTGLFRSFPKEIARIAEATQSDQSLRLLGEIAGFFKKYPNAMPKIAEIAEQFSSHASSAAAIEASIGSIILLLPENPEEAERFADYGARILKASGLNPSLDFWPGSPPFDWGSDGRTFRERQFEAQPQAFTVIAELTRGAFDWFLYELDDFWHSFQKYPEKFTALANKYGVKAPAVLLVSRLLRTEDFEQVKPYELYLEQIASSGPSGRKIREFSKSHPKVLSVIFKACSFNGPLHGPQLLDRVLSALPRPDSRIWEYKEDLAWMIETAQARAGDIPEFLNFMGLLWENHPKMGRSEFIVSLGKAAEFAHFFEDSDTASEFSKRYGRIPSENQHLTVSSPALNRAQKAAASSITNTLARGKGLKKTSQKLSEDIQRFVSCLGKTDVSIEDHPLMQVVSQLIRHPTFLPDRDFRRLADIIRGGGGDYCHLIWTFRLLQQSGDRDPIGTLDRINRVSFTLYPEVRGRYFGMLEVLIQYRQFDLRILDVFIAQETRTWASGAGFKAWDSEILLNIAYAFTVIGPENTAKLYGEYGIEYFARYSPAQLRQFLDLAAHPSRNKPVMLVFISKADRGAFYYEGRRKFEHLMKGFSVVAVEGTTKKEWFSQIQKTSEKHGLISAMMIMGHGTKGGIQLGNGEDGMIRMEDRESFRASRKYFVRKPKIGIYACEAGIDGRNNIAQAIAEGYDAETYASTWDGVALMANIEKGKLVFEKNPWLSTYNTGPARL